MKIINLTIGKNPPVIRTDSGIYKAVCYKLVETKCEPTVNDSTMINLNRVFVAIENRIEYNSNISYTGVNSGNIRYQLFDDTSVIASGTITPVNNAFKVILPPLPVGYYYLEVYGYGGYNKVMVNVT